MHRCTGLALCLRTRQGIAGQEVEIIKVALVPDPAGIKMVREYIRKDLIAGSEYIAAWDQERCTHCGICVDRCVFGARTIEDDGVEYNPDKCYGCGLCATICPNDAIRMERRPDRSTNRHKPIG